MRRRCIIVIIFFKPCSTRSEIMQSNTVVCLASLFLDTITIDYLVLIIENYLLYLQTWNQFYYPVHKDKYEMRNDANPTAEEENPSNKQGGKNRNLAMISLAFVGAYTSLTAVSNLQASINAEHNVGLWSLVCMTAGAVISCLFFSTPFVHIFGYKWSIVSGQFGILAYVAVNMYPKMALMFPGKCILQFDQSLVFSNR